MINLDSVPLRHPFVASFAGANIPLPGDGFLASSALVMLASLAAAIVIAHFTPFGANVYAIGGDRASAALMGVPMRRTTISIYALGGFYSALGGVIYALYTSSGYPLAGSGNELNAIASVVLGGTVLTGGVGLGGRHFVRGHDSRSDRDPHRFQRIAERSLDHDQQRRSLVSVHSSASLARRCGLAASPSSGVVELASSALASCGERSRQSPSRAGDASCRYRKPPKRGPTSHLRPELGCSAHSVESAPLERSLLPSSRAGSAAKSSAASIPPVRCCQMRSRCARAIRFRAPRFAKPIACWPRKL